jgi:hypothetical protein
MRAYMPLEAGNLQAQTHDGECFSPPPRALPLDSHPRRSKHSLACLPGWTLVWPLTVAVAVTAVVLSCFLFFLLFLADEKNRRCRRCCGGFVLSRAKYGCLLASVCGLLTGLVLIILIFAIVPAILRSQLNKSTLAFETMLIRGVPAEGRVNVESTVTIGNVISMAQAQVRQREAQRVQAN